MLVLRNTWSHIVQSLLAKAEISQAGPSVYPYSARCLSFCWVWCETEVTSTPPEKKITVLKRLMKVFKLSHSNSTTAWPTMKSVNQGVSGSRNWKYLVSTIVKVRLEPGNSEMRIRGNGQWEITRWEMKTNCRSTLLLLLSFLNEIY